MAEVDGSLPVTGADGPVTLLDTFEGRRQLIAYYHMWYPGQPAEDQCEGCTWYTNQIAALSHLHSRDVTYATFSQGPYDESRRYRDFMGWEMPWYSVVPSVETLLAGRRPGMFHLVCYVRQDDRVFETYWTRGRGVEAIGGTYGLLDMTVHGRQEKFEDSPAGWPQQWGNENNAYRTGPRPIPQWPRLEAGFSDDLGNA